MRCLSCHYSQGWSIFWFNCPEIHVQHHMRYSSVSEMATWGGQINTGPREDPPLLKQQPKVRHFVLKHLRCSGPPISKQPKVRHFVLKYLKCSGPPISKQPNQASDIHWLEGLIRSHLNTCMHGHINLKTEFQSAEQHQCTLLLNSRKCLPIVKLDKE